MSLIVWDAGIAAGGAVRTGLVRGCVARASSGDPLEGFPLRLVGNGVLRLTRSAAGGEFRFENLPPGIYRLEGDLAGAALSNPGPVRVEPGSTTDIILLVDIEETHLERVTVTGGPAGSRHEGTQREVYDGRTLRARPGALGDPMRALRGSAGIRTDSDLKSEAGMRGGAGADTRVVLDGLPVLEPFHFAGGAGTASALSGDLVESVEVHAGGFSVEHGDALSGVVEIRTPRDRPERLIGRAGIDTTHGRIALAGPVARNGVWRLAGRAGDMGLYEASMEGEEIEEVAFRDLYGGVEFTLRGGARLAAWLMRGASEFDQKVGDSGRVVQVARHAAGSVRIETPIDERTLLRATLGRGVSDASSGVTGGSSYDEFLETEEARASLIRLLGSRHALHAGLSLSVDRASIAGRIDRGAGPGPAAIDEVGRTGGLYVEDRWEGSPRVGLRYGIRLDRFSLTGESEISPRLSIVVTPHAGLAFSGAAGRFVQFPRPRQRFLASGSPLRAQIADEVIVGLERRFPGGRRLLVEAFARDLRHPIGETVNLYVDLPEAMARFERGRVRGLEIAWERSQAGPWRWRFDYARMRASQQMDGERFPMNSDQRHALTALIGRRLGRGWDLSATARFSTGHPFTPVVLRSNGIDAWTEAGALNAASLPDYHRLDLRLSRTLPTARGRVTLHVDLINVYDRDNVRNVDVTYDPATRTLTRTRRLQAPFMPVFGFSAEF